MPKGRWQLSALKARVPACEAHVPAPASSPAHLFPFARQDRAAQPSPSLPGEGKQPLLFFDRQTWPSLEQRTWIFRTSCADLGDPVVFRHAQGRQLGRRQVRLRALEGVQWFRPLLAFRPQGVELAPAVVRLVEGQGRVSAYASRVDNRTGDGSTIRAFKLPWQGTVRSGAGFCLRTC